MKVPTLKTAVGAGFVLLLLNTGYISAVATASIFYMGNVLLHLVLGLVLAVAFALLLEREPELRRPLIAPSVFFAIALGRSVKYKIWSVFRKSIVDNLGIPDITIYNCDARIIFYMIWRILVLI